MNKTVYETIPNGPNRVIVDVGALGESPKRAYQIYGIIPDIIFLRHDGWTLGAPKQFERIAYRLWKNEWSNFVRRGSNTWVDINEYTT